MKRIIGIILVILFTISLTNCKKDNSSPVSPKIGTGKIIGQVKFLDNTPASFANIQLRNYDTAISIYNTADADGNYIFDELKDGNYLVRFQSAAYEMNVYESALYNIQSDSIRNDFTITYRMLDDQSVYVVNTNIYFIKFNADGGKIGNNLNAVGSLTGYYSNDFFGTAVLSARVFLIPDDFNWMNDSEGLTPEFIENNFDFLFEVEESVEERNHSIAFSGGQIETLISNPGNGFAFVKVGTDEQIIKVPCVDRQNNDYGLLFNYNF